MKQGLQLYVLLLIEGEESGVVEDFNPEEFLQKLNAEYEAEVRTL